MSEAAATPEEAPAGVPKKRKGGMAIVSALVAAILSGGASFGASKLAGPPPQKVVVEEKHDAPPGPTLALDAFLVNVNDATKKPHAMKVTMAIEFEAAGGHEPDFKALTPRLRDAAISHLRSLTYEEASGANNAEKIKTDLLERFKHAGAPKAQRVLVTDLVVQ